VPALLLCARPYHDLRHAREQMARRLGGDGHLRNRQPRSEHVLSGWHRSGPSWSPALKLYWGDRLELIRDLPPLFPIHQLDDMTPTRRLQPRFPSMSRPAAKTPLPDLLPFKAPADVLDLTAIASVFALIFILARD
jgi:hypothetical protein